MDESKTLVLERYKAQFFEGVGNATIDVSQLKIKKIINSLENFRHGYLSDDMGLKLLACEIDGFTYYATAIVQSLVNA